MQNTSIQRKVQTSTPFFLPVTVPFTGVVNENPAPFFTNPVLSPGNFLGRGGGDIEILGMISDLVDCTAQFSLNKIPIWSTARIPLTMLFGKPDGPKPVLWLQEPFTLRSKERIRCDLLNTGGEPAGTLVFVGRLVNPDDKAIIIPANAGGFEDTVIIDSGFTASASDDNFVQSPIITEDFLVSGLHTNLADAKVRITGVGGRLWMEDPVPLWALAGRATSTLPNQKLAQDYIIPGGSAITVEFTNPSAEASGQLFLKGRSFPKGVLQQAA